MGFMRQYSLVLLRALREQEAGRRLDRDRSGVAGGAAGASRPPEPADEPARPRPDEDPACAVGQC